MGRRDWSWSPLSVLLLVVVLVTGCGISPRADVPRPVVAAQQPTKDPDVSLLLRLKERRLYLVENGVKRPPEGYRVAIGQPKWPTPSGRFEVNEMVENPEFLTFDFNDPTKPNRGSLPPGPDNPLGLRWIGFASAHGWQVGFHGTAKTSVLGQAVSHGCVRMSNPDVVEVYKHVRIGTPVIVEN